MQLVSGLRIDAILSGRTGIFVHCIVSCITAADINLSTI